MSAWWMMAVEGICAACLSAPDRCKRRLPSLRSEILGDARADLLWSRRIATRNPTGSADGFFIALSSFVMMERTIFLERSWRKYLVFLTPLLKLYRVCYNSRLVRHKPDRLALPPPSPLQYLFLLELFKCCFRSVLAIFGTP